MFFIFGWGKTTVTDYGSLNASYCGNCNNMSSKHLIKIRKWFTLFFIPVIPYESNYQILCSNYENDL